MRDGTSATNPSQEEETRAESVALFADVGDGSRDRRLSRPSCPIQPADRFVTFDPLDDPSDDLLTCAFQTPGDVAHIGDVAHTGDVTHTVIRGIGNRV